MNQIPPPADERLVSQIAQGGPIGQCLNEALNDLVSETFAQQVEQESNGVTFDSKMAERVMCSFGRAVAETDWKDSPAALLRGRVDHYNKVEQKWRIVVKDGEIRPRAPLDNGRSTRKRQKTSLWDANVAQDSESVELSGAWQILAYNDS